MFFAQLAVCFLLRRVLPVLPPPLCGAFLLLLAGFAAGAADGAHVHAQGNVLVDHDGPGITGESFPFRFALFLFSCCTKYYARAFVWALLLCVFMCVWASVHLALVRWLDMCFICVCVFFWVDLVSPTKLPLLTTRVLSLSLSLGRSG